MIKNTWIFSRTDWIPSIQRDWFSWFLIHVANPQGSLVWISSQQQTSLAISPWTLKDGSEYWKLMLKWIYHLQMYPHQVAQHWQGVHLTPLHRLPTNFAFSPWIQSNKWHSLKYLPSLMSWLVCPPSGSSLASRWKKELWRFLLTHFCEWWCN